MGLDQLDRLITLRSDAVQAVVAPHLGGRLLQYTAAGRQWLWTNDDLLDSRLRLRVDPRDAVRARTIAEWFNYGGDKCWPAPQAREGHSGWTGPPDAVLDAGEYDVVECAESDRGPLVLRSRPDPVTGVQIERTFELTSNGAELTTTNRVTNVSKHVREWSAWAITQLPVQPGDVVDVAVDREGAPPVLLATVEGPAIVARPHPGFDRVHAVDCVGKIGFPAATGCATFRTQAGPWLEQRFAVDDTRTYPDDGSRFEIWMQYPVEQPLADLAGWRPSAHLLELECLAPLTALAPGASSTLVVGWRTGTSTNG